MSLAAATAPVSTPSAFGARIGTWVAEQLKHLGAPAESRVGTLDKTRVARIDHPRGRRITCVAGSLWLTFDGEPSDTVLEAGQSIVCEHDTPLHVSAFGMATWRAE
jgi:quercetin dioxygenase-like cupin family protein